MKKALTHIHLLMEKKSFSYLKDIALELADFYGYKTKVKIKKGRYQGEKGFYHWHDNTIHIDPNQSPKEFIIVFNESVIVFTNAYKQIKCASRV